MKTLKIILRFIFIEVILALLIAGAKFIYYTVKTFLKVLWLSSKLTIKFLFKMIYLLSRIIAWPFRKCFPPKDIDELSGLEFEQFCQNWLALEGFRSIIRTPSSSDYGVDILSIKGDEHIGIQCKRYSGNVGVGAIQEITAGLQYYECQRGMVITNSYFTKNAIELANANNIDLIDGITLKNNRSCKVLTQNTFQMRVGVFIMFLFILISLWLTILSLIHLKRMLPLIVMLLGICIMTFINGCIEIKTRSDKDQEDSTEEDLSEEIEITDPF